MDYIDCLLVHTPLTSPEEFRAGIVPHFFEFAHDQESGKDGAAQEMAIFERSMKIEPIKTIDGDDLLELVTEARMARHRKKGIDFEQAYECRAKTWENLEKALKQGKAKMIGVSNYPANILREMTTYASVMPAVNQIEFTTAL